ncbi:MAG: hypothetical protein ACI9KE_003212 [Polyangiales bacterium]|jgi:hypothetical protein
MKTFRVLITLAVALVSLPAAAQRPIPVNITTTPAGATVYVDSAETPAIGVTPLSRVRIPRGNHTLIFRLENHSEAQLPVNIRRWNESFTQALASLGVITISAGAPEMTGAEVRIDGVAEGAIPVRLNVEPGRHLIQIGQEGYVTFSQWAEVAGGQIFALPVLMQREAPRTGSLLIAGDVSGAVITIDGTPRGTTPAVIDGLAEGQHTVSVAPVAEGQTPFEQTVLVTAGERAVVHPTMQPAPPAGGSLRILANAEGAVIRLDGEVLGNAPASREDIPPGDHIIEASAPGYDALQQPVTVEAGRQQVVSLAMVAVQLAPGVIVVNSDVDNATVTVDGTERGTTPVVIEDAQPGVHPIIVTAPGRATFRTTCNTAPGQDCRITAELASAPVDVVFRANISEGTLFVDGEEIGPVPYEGTLPAGSRRVEVRAEGYRTYQAQVVLAQAEAPRAFDVSLIGNDELTPDEIAELEGDRATRHRQAVARSGGPLDDDFAILDFSVGWPYLFEGRLGIGILPWLEAGVAVRTFVRLTEFEARVKAGYRVAPQFSAGAQVRVGGGIGPSHGATLQEEGLTGPTVEATAHNANNFFFSLEALGTLHFTRAGNFTLWAALDFHSDRWDYNGRNNDCPGLICDDDGPTVYTDAERTMPATDRDGFFSDRQTMARFRIGGSLEFIVAQNWNVWGSFEGVFGDNRRVLGDIFGLGNEDISIYARLGLTYKFDYSGD